MGKEIILKSIITCPNGGHQHQKEETMLTDACQYFYECENCKSRVKGQKQDTVACFAHMERFHARQYKRNKNTEESELD